MMSTSSTSLSLILCVVLFVNIRCSHQRHAQQSNEPKPLTVLVIGDAGEPNSILHDNANCINDMYNGRHDAGKPDALIFLGDNFYETGLNVPADEVHSMITKVLGPFRETLVGLGRANVHAIPGNHDYYARNVLEKSLLFGLINIKAGPTGISDRGNEREKAIEWWTYYYKMPAVKSYPIFGGASDSVQFFFFDSAVLLKTDIATWTPSLDSLRRLLRASRLQHGIVWRVLALHHPWYSVGAHGGWSVWDDVEKRVTYLPNCDKDSNAVNWFVNNVDPQDLCANKYQQMLDSLKSVIRASGTKMHLTLAGHEHNLQLLSYPNNDSDCTTCPKVHVISGAGAKATIVRFPAPPNEFTSSQPKKKGEPMTGFAQLQFHRDSLRVAFFSSATDKTIDMGGGQTEFWIGKNGDLLPWTRTIRHQDMRNH